MKFTYYAAPINVISNKAYRHLLLNYQADYVFSELIRIDKLDYEKRNNKLETIEGDEARTIWQIGVSCIEEIDEAIRILKENNDKIYEININMGCPHSSLEKKKYCSGILNDTDLMKELSSHLAKECHKINNNIKNSENKKILASVKIRIGTRFDHNRIKEYLDILNQTGIDKVYIHMRYLTYNYTKPALYYFLENAINDKQQNHDRRKLNLEDYKFEIILNGDLDSYEKCEKLNKKFSNKNFQLKSFMVGRASIHNPLIFEDLKNDEKEYLEKKTKSSQKKEIFDPIHNNRHFIKNNRTVYLSKEQKEVIKEYKNIAKSNNLRNELVHANLSWMLKGVCKEERDLFIE